MTVTRSATLTRGPSTPDGMVGEYVSDSGFKTKVLERPIDAEDHPAIPPGRYLCLFANHPERGWCYELQEVEGRTAILIHGANVIFQLLGCLAPFTTAAKFKTGAIHKEGEEGGPMPPRDCDGGSYSGKALEALQNDMKNPTTRAQEPFYITIC